MVIKMKGKVIKYGDNISTDLIIAGKYTKTLNKQDLVDHACEDLDDQFHEKLKTRKIMVAGSYFGCGSSREQAPVALKESGVTCILAKTFSRIFYRNAINLGLLVAECNTDLIDDFDEIEYKPEEGMVFNLSKNMKISVSAMPKIMMDILSAGGVINYINNEKQTGAL